jgi:hypothetical protein
MKYAVDIHTKFHWYWLNHSKVNKGNTQTHRQHGARISLILLFLNKKSRLKIEHCIVNKKMLWWGGQKMEAATPQWLRNVETTSMTVRCHNPHDHNLNCIVLLRIFVIDIYMITWYRNPGEGKTKWKACTPSRDTEVGGPDPAGNVCRHARISEMNASCLRGVCYKCWRMYGWET